MKHFIFCLALASVFAVSQASGQAIEFYSQPQTPAEFWRAMQFEMNVGKFDIAARQLKGLLDSKPSDKDLLELEDKFTLTPFLALRNVERWSANKNDDTEARANVETLIEMISAALRKELGDPERIAKFARNLTGTPEEVAFAVKELTRSGADAVPVLINLLRGNEASPLRAAILETLPLLGVATVPAILPCLDAPSASLRLELLNAIRKRTDYASLSFWAESDPIPYLWRFLAPGNSDALRARAHEMLLGLLGSDPAADRDLARRQPQWRLARLAETFLEQKARFRNPERTTVWKFDGGRLTGTPMSVSDAEEYFGLRYAGWAVEIQPDDEDAQRVFITLALTKHRGRASVDVPLAKSSPALYGILATAPYGLLNDLLESYLREQRAAPAIWVSEVIGDRHESRAVRPSDKPGTADYRPSLLLKALDYPDRRVRFAAVNALLKAPGAPGMQRSSLIVKILAGYVQADKPEDAALPRALLGDPDPARTEALASILRRAGFAVESVRTGKELIRRLQQQADIDLVVIDHHIPYPKFADTLTQLRTDFRTTALPIVVIASPDEPTTAHPINLLGRLTALVAADEQLTFARLDKTFADSRLRSPGYRFKLRYETLRKLLESAGIAVSGPVENRLEYLIWLTTAAGDLGWGRSLDQSRLTLDQGPRLARMAALRTDRLLGHIAENEEPFDHARELTPALSNLVARYSSSLPPETVALADLYWQIMLYGQRDKDGKLVQEPLPAVSIRHPEIEARLNRLTKAFRLVRVIPEVYLPDQLKRELAGFFTIQDAKELEADRQSHAKTAIEWLRKMAIGEVPGFPFAEAESSIRQALRNPELAPAAIDAAARLASRDAQEDLANLVLGAQPAPVRAQAADALVKQIQRYGLMLRDAQRQQLVEQSRSEADAPLKSRLEDLFGVIQSSAKGTGARLLSFTPALAVPAKDKKEAPKEEKNQEDVK